MPNSGLSAAQRSKIRRLAVPEEEDTAGKEINVVPFLDIVTNVLMFVLATVAVTFTATIDVKPSRPAIRAANETTLALTVLVVDEGFGLKARGGNVAPGCNGVGSGVAIPKRNGAFDYAGLRECAAKLKASDPSFADEEAVTVTASPHVPYETVIGAFDALRTASDGKNLFPEVAFGVAR